MILVIHVQQLHNKAYEKKSTKEINIIHRVDIIHILNKWFKLGIWPGGVFFENTVKPHNNTLYTVDATKYVTVQIDATFHKGRGKWRTVS